MEQQSYIKMVNQVFNFLLQLAVENGKIITVTSNLFEKIVRNFHYKNNFFIKLQFKPSVHQIKKDFFGELNIPTFKKVESNKNNQEYSQNNARSVSLFKLVDLVLFQLFYLV
jgi:hypothetical protein